MNRKILAFLLLVVAIGLGTRDLVWLRKPTADALPKTASQVGEQVPSEDSILKDFHSMGTIDGESDIYRSACPIRDLAALAAATTQPSVFKSRALARMQHLHDLGIRTDFCFQDPADDADSPAKMHEVKTSIAMEEQTAEAVGIAFVYRPLKNSGPDSLQTMSDQQVFDALSKISDEVLSDGKTGGVLFHCSAGHDRTGIVAAFMRMKYQHWTADQAIDEMRRLGHNWPRYSEKGATSSWHEQHLRAIAPMLNPPATQP